MYVSNTAVALTITMKEAPFTDKASMLRWMNYSTLCVAKDGVSRGG